MSDIATQELTLVDVLKPEVQADLYAFYDTLRERDPMYWDNPPGYPVGWWLVTRHADVTAALQDRRFSARRFADLDRVPSRVRPVARVLSQLMVYSDPPVHTRLRALVSKAFTPRMIESLRPRIEQLAAEFVDAVAAGHEMDVIQAIAAPLPITVIAELLGVAREDRQKFKQWGVDLSVVFGNARLSAAEAAAATKSLEELTAYFRAVVAHRRLEPRDDLLQSLITAEENHDTLTEEELYAHCLLLLLAGHETTTNLIGNGLLALLQNPEECHALRANPAMYATAIPELLRYDSPTQLAQRIAAEDLEFAGKEVRAGQQVLLVLGAANHDPAQFSEPHQLDLSRADNRHLSFGYGIHHCLGAALARLEGEIAIRTILDRFPTLRLATTTHEWQKNLSFRALTALPVAW